MTKRLQFPNFWAEGGTATDPDLDTTAPSFKADRYETIGWEAEKPPEDWQNFLSQITDQKILSMMMAGLMVGDPDVTYREGAIYKGEDGRMFVVKDGVGVPTVASTSELYKALVADLENKRALHLIADNPHNDTVNTLVDKSYEKEWVNAEFGSPYYPSTIIYHQNLTGTIAHGETAEQTGALHKDRGGSFTGDVTFEAALMLAPDQYLKYNRSNGLMELVKGTYSIGPGGSGNAYVSGPNGITLVISEANFDYIVIKYNNIFALPVPVMKARFLNALSDGDSIGQWIVTTTNDGPAWFDEKSGRLLVWGNPTTIWFPSMNFPVTVHMEIQTQDLAWHYPVSNFDTWNHADNTGHLNNIAAQLLNTPAEEIRAIGHYTVYPQLNNYQLYMLMVNYQ